MKNTLIAFTFLTVLACTATKALTTVGGGYDSVADIDLFLSTGDESIENQVLDRLKSHGVDSVQIKQFLRATLLVPNDNPVGLQSKLKLKMNNISEVTVFGEKNPIVGNIVCAKVSLTKDEEIKVFKNRLLIHCKQELQSYKVPLKILITNKGQYNMRFKKIRNITI